MDENPRSRVKALREEADRLERIIDSKSCAEGHIWESSGGCNAGCGDDCCCSVPVNRCVTCGDYDYGDNEDARDVRANCERLIDARSISADSPEQR